MRYSKERYQYDLFEGDERLLEEAPRLGWVNFHRPTSFGLGTKHQRADAYEIYYVVGGTLRMLVAGNGVEAEMGEVLIVRPGEEHAGLPPTDIIGPCELLWLELDLSKLAQSADFSPGWRRKLAQEMQGIRARTFRIWTETQGRFRQLVEEHRQAAGGSQLTARLVLYSLLANLVRDYRQAAAAGAEQAAPSIRSPGIQRVLDLVESRVAKPPSGREMVRASGMDAPKFYRTFREETGITPLEYCLRRRIREAMKEIEGTETPIIKISKLFGFSSSQYFTAVFHKFTGVTPRAYRRELRGMAGKPPAGKTPR